MTIATQLSTTNSLAHSLRETGKTDRDWEEARLQKRQKREEAKTNAASGPVSRSGSVAPGTPGSVAPDPDKALTKKEQKSKAAAAKAADAANTTTANRTSMAFLGMGSMGRKKGKSYSWMTGGGGASTPSRLGTSSTPGTPGATPAARAQEPQALTAMGRTKFGEWREDGSKGKDIQLRDWVVVLERDGRDTRALQAAYDKLDLSAPR